MHAEMRRLGRGIASTAVLSIVLTSCGLAALSTTAVAPDAVAHHPEIAAPAAPAHPAPAAIHEPILLQKAAAVPEPAVTPKATLPAASTAPMRHIWQSLNNCGPAAVVMALSTLGIADADQETARLALRGPDWNRGMGPGPVDPWVRSLYGLRSTWRSNGTHELMKSLVSNGFAPMVTQWMQDPWISRIGHWRTVTGYDDAKRVFYVNDSMLGRGVPLTYEWFDSNWQPFSYRWMVLYRPEAEPLVRAIVGPDWNERTMRQRFYERARGEALERDDSASWLAYGEASYQNGLFAEAVAAFEKGLALGSAQGVFTLRSSYPQALRALGREQDAAKAQQRLSGITSVTATVAPPPDAIAASIAQERARLEGVLFSE
jgi:hypothetical protein